MGSGVGTQGFRSMAVSSDGKYLAAGDCQGNLHIYNLRTSDYTCFQVDHRHRYLHEFHNSRLLHNICNKIYVI